MKIAESFKERFVVWIWNHTPNCAEMSRLASHSFEEPLPIQIRLRMGLHHLICVWCKRYAKHLIFLRAAVRRVNDQVDQSIPRPLPAEAKRRILKKLQSEQAGL